MRDVGLNDAGGALLEELAKRCDADHPLAGGDRRFHGALDQRDVVHRLRPARFLEPIQVVRLKRFCKEHAHAR